MPSALISFYSKDLKYSVYYGLQHSLKSIIHYSTLQYCVQYIVQYSGQRKSLKGRKESVPCGLRIISQSLW